MANSSPGLLISELKEDGPFSSAADDFLYRMCGDCRLPVDGDLVTAGGTYLCRACMGKAWKTRRPRV